jgi:anhydro-N-acetylmuramic acid kinase
MYELDEKDLLRTFCEHVAVQISKSLQNKTKGKVLVTGGGAYNTFLIECIQKNTNHDLIIPDKNLIEYKEAMLFAFLGVLRMCNEINCLKSVTGASENSCGGAVSHPTPSSSLQKGEGEA